MTTHQHPVPVPDPGVVNVLILVQGTLMAVSAAESIVTGVATGLAIGIPTLLSSALAIVLLTRARSRPLRLVRGIQWFVLASAAIDLVLAIALGRTLLDPVAIVTRIALPISILRLSPKEVAA